MIISDYMLLDSLLCLYFVPYILYINKFIHLQNKILIEQRKYQDTRLFHLYKEQITRLKAMSQHEQNEEVMRMKEIAIKKLEQEFKTSNTQELKLWNDMANGWANTILNAIR